MSILSLETRRHFRHNESNEISPLIADRKSSGSKENSFTDDGYFYLSPFNLTAVVYIIRPFVVHIRIILQFVQFFRDTGRIFVIDFNRIFSSRGGRRFVMIRFGKIFERVVQSPVDGFES